MWLNLSDRVNELINIAAIYIANFIRVSEVDVWIIASRVYMYVQGAEIIQLAGFEFNFQKILRRNCNTELHFEYENK